MPDDDDLVTLLVGRLDELRERLDEAVWARVRALLHRIAAEPDESAGRVWPTLLELVRTSLPVGHPLRRAIAAEFDDYRAGPATRELSATLERLREMLPDLAELDLDDEIRGVRERLLAAPSLPPEELRAAGVDPDLPGLLRLRRADGTVSLPGFQFGAGHVPRPVVLTVNGVLGAETDPWGAADWWLRGNALLGDVPARLVGTGGAAGENDRLVVEAARALREEY